MVQFLGTTGIVAVRVVASVVAIQRARGTVAVVRIDAETQSQCRNTALPTAISRFRRASPDACLDRGADGFNNFRVAYRRLPKAIASPLLRLRRYCVILTRAWARPAWLRFELSQVMVQCSERGAQLPPFAMMPKRRANLDFLLAALLLYQFSSDI